MKCTCPGLGPRTSSTRRGTMGRVAIAIIRPCHRRSRGTKRPALPTKTLRHYVINESRRSKLLICQMGMDIVYFINTQALENVHVHHTDNFQLRESDPRPQTQKAGSVPAAPDGRSCSRAILNASTIPSAPVKSNKRQPSKISCPNTIKNDTAGAGHCGTPLYSVIGVRGLPEVPSLRAPSDDHWPSPHWR
ncbi:jg8255 [Pararge aegeria aegeria]|uniref:Jg8255 protein n=1 Tax=Pararge aegeria aegeria TaxID=348720 RepID=A0A8S4RQE3_9NEOP|nr:jg8255 [Pararge aegeria aegeria]